MGVWLMLSHPEIPSCADCCRWIYDTKWKRLERPKGMPVLRPEGSIPQCHRCPKSVDGLPNPQSELSAKNSRAFRLYLQIKAGRPMPSDPIVMRNCGLIRWVEDSLQRDATLGLTDIWIDLAERR